MPVRTLAICSDSTVGRSDEDYSIADLTYPATTRTASLLKSVAAADVPRGSTVFFATYQSTDVVARDATFEPSAIALAINLEERLITCMSPVTALASVRMEFLPETSLKSVPTISGRN